MIGAKGSLNLLDKFVLFFNYLFGFALVISYLAPYVDPKNFWPVAFFGLAYPPLLLLNILLIFYWLFRFKIQIGISILCIAAGWGILQKNIGFHKTTDDAKKADSSYIRMMAYNVHSFNSPQNYNISTRREILQVIKDQQPDILNIEEFYSQSVKNAICDSVKKAMRVQYYYFQPFATNGNTSSGLAIFSRYPIITTGIIRLADDMSDTKSIYADVKLRDKMIRVYCVHLQSFLLSAQDHDILDNAQNGKANIHASRRIGGKLKQGFMRRSEQVKMMREEMAKSPYPYIVAGDFNDTPSSYAVNQMSSGLKNTFREQGRGLGRTYNGDVPNYQIDYIMCSPQFKVINYSVVEKKLSDHYPIRSDLLIP